MLSVPLHAFWTKILQGVFQMQMDQITNRLPGIIAILDDNCVYGKDTTEHYKFITTNDSDRQLCPQLPTSYNETLLKRLHGQT